MNKSLSNKQLEDLKKGNEQPLYDIYTTYRDEFISWAKKSFKLSEDSAKDIFQDSVLDLYQNIITGKLTELTCSTKTYLFQIGKHKTLNLQRKESKTTYLDTLQCIDNKEAESFMKEQKELYTQEEISKAIEKLPDDCQKVLRLFYFKEYDMDSIARELAYKNANTAKSKKSLCLKNLMKELKKMSKSVIL